MRRFVLMVAALALLGAVFPLAALGHDPEIPAVPFDEESGAAHHSDVGLATASASSSGATTGKHRNLTEIGSLSFPDGANTDVWAHGNFAYVGTFSSGTAGFCPGTGVKIADVSDPTDPTFVTNIASPTSDILIPFVPGLQPGEIHTRANDVKVETVSSRHFRGDLLVHTNEPCDGLGDGGIVLWDVTDPTNPQRLGSIYDLADLINGAPTGEAFGVHNTWIFERGNRTYVGLVANIDPDAFDFRIVDVTDPANPVSVGQWSSTVSPDAPPAETRGTSRSLGLHDVTVNGNGKVAYLSYWDAGYILLDVSDPTNPSFMGVTGWETEDEGNAHAAWPARGGNLLVTSDEDFSPNGLAAVTTSVALGAFGTDHEATEAVFTPPLSGPLGPDDVAWIGKGAGINTAQAFGCASNPADPTAGPAVAYGEPVAGKIALIQRGVCNFDEKVAVAQEEGAIGVIVFNDAREDLITMGGNPSVGSVTINIPAMFIRGSRGNELAALRDANTAVQATLTPGAFNGFGFVRVFDISDPANPVKLSEVKLPSTNDPNAPPFGSHNVMVRGNTAYVAWYTDGLVVVDISKPTAPQVIAQAVDPSDNYWGVYVQGELIFTSDRDGGLKIYKHVP